MTAIRDPALAVPAFARAYAVAEVLGGPLLDTLAAALCRRWLVLVVDNVEQVLTAAPAVTRALGPCVGVKVLATSRAALRVAGEHEFPVLPCRSPPRPTPNHWSG